MDPEVSDPMQAAARFAEAAMPGPELEPLGESTGRPSPPDSGYGK